MPGISVTKIPIPFRSKGFSFSSYWATRNPSGLQLTWTSDTEITAAWTDAADAADGLKLYLSTDNVNWTLADTVAFGVQAGSATVTAGVVYWFKLVAYKGTNESDPVLGQVYEHRVLSTQAANLLPYFMMNEASGTAVQDRTANNWDGVYRNGPTLAQAGIGDGRTATVFDGSDDNINIDKPDFCSAFDGDEGTLMIWIKADATILQDGAGHYVVSLNGVTGTQTINFYKTTVNNNLTVVRSAGGINNLFDFKTLTAEWTCLIFTWSFTRQEHWLYVNGVNLKYLSTLVNQFDGILNHDRTVIGQTYANTQRFKGQLAHFAVWSKFLEAGEAYALGGLHNSDNTAHELFTRLTVKALVRGTAPSDWLGRPVLCKAASGEWVAVYRVGIDHNTPDASVVHHIIFTNDEGATWSAANKTTGGADVTNAPFAKQSTNTNQPGACLFKCPNNDLILIIYETGGAAPGSYQWRSTNNGAGWAVEGRILNSANYICEEDYTIVGSDIYITARDITDGAGNEDTVLIKSSDNGANWSIVADIQNSLDGNEIGITHTTGNDMLAVMKGSDLAHTYLYRTSDLGATWSAAVDITSLVGVIHKPRLYYLDGKVVLVGRYYIDAVNMMTVVHVTSDNGLTWSERFHPELPGVYQDAGYCDLLQRADGTYYMLGYAGMATMAVIKEYTFEDA